MANHENIVFSLLVLLTAYSWAVAVRQDMMLKNNHIRITNDLPKDIFHLSSPNAPQLFVHCKSSDRDIGPKAMLNGEVYTWDTKINFFRTTLFFCYARWENFLKNGTFDLFKATRDEDRCLEHQDTCFWSVRSDGFYFSNTWE
ncbi:S-protein homolog 20-like [Hibiscus syriacus]|uniref:S-protein homolog 20-like n=1 Tax=Hibiscus syriacus TaxID=106335 RepID=UPI0019227E23|nr:S-protein homolog 20-like [Hibiscus syriacus]XP_039037521.1 S-protein homolog 20-like [Hibiscus syriacus]